MAKITEEQRARLLELALLSYLNKKQSNIFKDDFKPPKKTPEPRPRPGAVDLTKICPECGSQNILEPNRDFNQHWECLKCRAEFPEPVWGEPADRRCKMSGSAIPNAQQTTKTRRAEKATKKAAKKAVSAQKKAEKTAATGRWRAELVADRVRDSTWPVCPNCGLHSYRRCKTRSNEKIQYRCRSCGFVFDQPLKPGKVTAPWTSYRAPDRRAKERRKTKWEQKIAESTARWHEKFDRGESDGSSGDMPKVQQ